MGTAVDMVKLDALINGKYVKYEKIRFIGVAYGMNF